MYLDTKGTTVVVFNKGSSKVLFQARVANNVILTKSLGLH